uniref:FHA domain-containing protein n=1 Tax=Streptomyces alboniger TaxID=132473 RepID=UPI000ADC300F
MQIRLTVLGPRSGQPEQQGRPPAATGVHGACDVLVTAPAGTALAAVASGLATAVAGSDSPLVLYAGPERLDAQRCTLGEPPLIDGAVLSLGAPAEPGPEPAGAAAQLHVVAGPDAGGVHLLHGGQIRVGRSADADVPLDDPDVSRLHCAVTLAQDGRVTVTDLGSTNGTSVDGTEVTDRPVRVSPGSLLRIGESALRLTGGGLGAAPGAGGILSTAPDGEGHVRVRVAAAPQPAFLAPSRPPEGTAHHAYGSADWGAAGGDGTHRPSGAHGTHGASGAHGTPGAYETHGPHGSQGDGPSQAYAGGPGAYAPGGGPGAVPPQGGVPDAERTRAGTPPRGTTVPRALRKRSGLSAWARRLAGGRGSEQDEGAYESYEAYADDEDGADGGLGAPEPTPEDLAVAAAARTPESWPDPATLLLTALGPGPRLWERGPGHPEALAVRLGTVDRVAPGDQAPLPAVPVTVSLREAGALGLAGPRERLTGLARAVVAQLGALHSPDCLEIVLISTDRTRTTAERTAEWAWLGWLPHLRPTHGQDCRLLLAYDRDQAATRTGELIRRLDDHIADEGVANAGKAGPFGGPDPLGGPGSFGEPGSFGAPGSMESAAREPAWRTVVIVDGDPGSAALREATVRLAGEGARAGIHVVCLAETEAASYVSRTGEAGEAASVSA